MRLPYLLCLLLVAIFAAPNIWQDEAEIRLKIYLGQANQQTTTTLLPSTTTATNTEKISSSEEDKESGDTNGESAIIVRTTTTATTTSTNGKISSSEEDDKIEKDAKNFKSDAIKNSAASTTTTTAGYVIVGDQQVSSSSEEDEDNGKVSSSEKPPTVADNTTQDAAAQRFMEAVEGEKEVIKARNNLDLDKESRKSENGMKERFMHEVNDTIKMQAIRNSHGISTMTLSIWFALILLLILCAAIILKLVMRFSQPHARPEIIRMNNRYVKVPWTEKGTGVYKSTTVKNVNGDVCEYVNWLASRLDAHDQ